jgi:dTDP-4-amino-4,6-dideoxygalactose transaminase
LKKKIFVTKTSLPPLNEYIKYLRSIWKNNIVTNHGPLSIELEHKLRKYLNVQNLLFVSNGTVALEVAIKALGIEGDIITTPFTYVATTSAIIWTGCKPVYVDIDENSLCIDHKLIEKSITKRTKAILATHVYGNPCNVEEIEKIAKKHKIKVIYDAAHAFGINYKGRSVLNYGDISTLSFHATKLFHTIEGGALVTCDANLAGRLFLYKSFGHIGDYYYSPGINGKNSEFHAAMGLCNLPRIKGYILSRKRLYSAYRALLRNNDSLKFPEWNKNANRNYMYYPVIFESKKEMLKVKIRLEESGFYPRRYFYPSLNKLPYVKAGTCKISESISERVLSLPFYHDLPGSVIVSICKIVNGTK